VLRPSSRRTGTPADLLVIGLGNPGAEYEGTRHNVGAEVVGLLAERHGGRLRAGKELARSGEVRIDGRLVALAFPQTFMNESGRSVVQLVRRHGIEDLGRLVVVHDELDLALGRLQVKVGGGIAGHNGLRSLRDHLHSTDFLRVRIGIGRPPGRQSGADFVLRRPSKAERAELDVIVVEAADAVEAILRHGAEAAMNAYNGGREASGSA
jgi:PTH1 family peptidyl-tRNA hydrolase